MLQKRDGNRYSRATWFATSKKCQAEFGTNLFQNLLRFHPKRLRVVRETEGELTHKSVLTKVLNFSQGVAFFSALLANDYFKFYTFCNEIVTNLTAK